MILGRKQHNSSIRSFWALLAVFLCINASVTAGTNRNFLSWGPAIHDFKLTLQDGRRREIGPFYYEEKTDNQTTRAFPPFFSKTKKPSLEYEEMDFLYPLMTFDRFGGEKRVQLMQLLSFSVARDQDLNDRGKLTIFPFYYQQRSTNASSDYTAVFPFYGRLVNRMLRDEIEFVMFPLYSKTRKRDVVTRNYLYPFFHRRKGEWLRGWQFWPVMGRELKVSHSKTNNFGEPVFVSGHRKDFALWPFLINEHRDVGTTNEVREHAVLPLYSALRSPARDSTTVLWPFFTYTEDHEKRYREWGLPWPLLGFARGEGKRMNRVWPFFSRSSSDTLRSDFYAWPILKINEAKAAPLHRKRYSVIFFLYSDLTESNIETGQARRRLDLWPVFHWKRELDGRERLRVPAVLESMLPNNKSVERNWSPLWSIWRSEKNPLTGARSQSLLWNLWRRETTPDTEKSSLFFGLVQYESDATGRRWKWFHARERKASNPEPDNASEKTAQMNPVNFSTSASTP
ncbi:MAG: hypothetical protein CMO80_13665 [Verrucomicrobiales bacterium]|nr:hypothetical protein [Verrucomicrobiales bacterium]